MCKAFDANVIKITSLLLITPQIGNNNSNGKPCIPFASFVVKKILDNVTFSSTKEHTSLTTLLFSPHSKTDKRVIKNTFVSIYLLKFATVFTAVFVRDKREIDLFAVSSIY